MATGKKEKVFVVGVGMTKFEKPGKTEGDYPDMARTAILRALHDAHVPFSAVQVAAAGFVYGDSTCGQRAVYSVGMTGIPIYNVNNNCSTGSTALYLGKQLVEGGLYSCALAVGFEKMERGSLGTKYTDRTNPMDKHMETMSRTRGVTDAPFAPQMFGNAGREHMDKYGTQAKHFAMVALKNHKHSANNPYSQFRDQYTLEQIMASPRVFDPLTKLQCCPTSDGAAAAILCNERFVVEHNLQSQAVEIVSMVMKTDTLSTFQDSCIKMVGYDMSKAAAQEVFRQSGMTPNDVQVVELHDCFSCNELLTYEALGLCPEGQGGKLIETGAVTYGGKWVVNPSGGLISKGHPLGATGLAQCAELNWQLRNMCGPRQVPNCKYALQHNIGLGGAVVVTLYRAGFPSALKPYSPNLPNPALGQNFDDKGAAAPAGAPAASSVSLKSDALFAQIQAGLKADPSVAKKVGGVYQFNVAGQDTKKTWTVDLKSSPPTVKDAAAEKADCIISVSDSDLCDLVSGKANGQKLFMAGKLKVQGNMAMTMKLDQLFKASKPTTAGASGAVSFKSDEVFAQVKAGLSADPSTAKKVGGIYQFNVTGDGGAKKTWAVDLKATPPVVKDAAADKPECTITLSDSDLVNLVAGKSNGQQLFMQGKLKIQGNMALAMKLDQLFKAGKNAPAAAAAAPAASAAKFASDAVFDQIKAGLKSDPSLAKKVGGVYQFNVTGDGGAKKTWAVDLKASPPVVKDSSADKPECTITIADADMVNMTTGKANGQQLFMQGKLKIQGNMALAMKLDQLVKKKASL